MTEHRRDFPSWTRRDFVRAGLTTAGALAVDACTRTGTSRARVATGSAADLDDLARTIRGRLLRDGSPLYDEARRVWNLAYDRRPLAMARCADVDDVRRCVEFARRHSLPVAIRGGGHSYAGFGVADGALQIDLGALNTVTVDRDRRVASVGGGTRIRELLTATLAAGLYTPMGGCGSVGVAGLALAGGDTGGRGLFGTACDNVIGAQYPEGEVWASTGLAVDGAFLEGVGGEVVDVLARAAVAGRGVGAILMGLSNGVASRVGMTDTAYPLRGTGLSCLLSAEWKRSEDRQRAERWVAEYGAALRPWARRAYVNYLGPSSTERIREIYGVNYPRLARIKGQYDPANLFRSNQNVQPAVRS